MPENPNRIIIFDKLEDGVRTADIAYAGEAPVGTREMGDSIIKALEKGDIL